MIKMMVDPIGIEPTTSTLPVWREGDLEIRKRLKKALWSKAFKRLVTISLHASIKLRTEKM
ncbi:hypothetical protein C0R09_04800 [Brevibacillus laterosporus]|nr:hypothetical protein C0R09_04800 [Brevibacillus laterosporus]